MFPAHRLIQRRRNAVSVAFLAFGAAIGSWLPRLPALKEHLHLTDGEIGAGLLMYSVGAVAGAAAVRAVLSRGARAPVRVATVLLCAATAGLGLAGSLVTLIAAFFALGVLSGFVDVLENAQAAELEHEAGRPLINSFHGFWTLGALVASLAASAAAYLNVAPTAQFAAAGAVIAIASAWALRDLPDTRSGAAASPPDRLPKRPPGWDVMAVSVIAFCALIVEAGSSNWSALYLRDVSHASAALAAIGVTSFLAAATIVRFLADRLTSLAGRAAVMRTSAVLAGAGLAIAMAVPSIPGAMAGFALSGMGTAVLIPLAFRAGANLGRSGTALAIVVSAGYAGSIVSPGLIGNTADRVGLRFAMLIPLLAAAVIAFLSPAVDPSSGRPASR